MLLREGPNTGMGALTNKTFQQVTHRQVSGVHVHVSIRACNTHSDLRYMMW